MAKNLPVMKGMQETWVRFPIWEDPLEKEMAPVFLPGNPMDRGAGYSHCGLKRVIHYLMIKQQEKSQQREKGIK